jgi:hypothetical protein
MDGQEEITQRFLCCMAQRGGRCRNSEMYQDGFCYLVSSEIILFGSVFALEDDIEHYDGLLFYNAHAINASV